MNTGKAIGSGVEAKTVLEDLRNQHAQRRAQEQNDQSGELSSGNSGGKSAVNNDGCGEFIG